MKATVISENNHKKLTEFRIKFQKENGRQIGYKHIVNLLIEKAKYKDIV